MAKEANLNKVEKKGKEPIFGTMDFQNLENVFTLARQSCVANKQTLAGVMNFEEEIKAKMNKANGKVDK